MYERFTDRAKLVMQLATKVAGEFNHEYIGSEHIMLGLLNEKSGGVARCVLTDLGISEYLEKSIRDNMTKGPEIVTMGLLPRTPRAALAISKATEWTQKLNHSHVGTEHLLLGVLDVEDTVPMVLIQQSSVTVEAVRQRCLEFIGSKKIGDDPPLKCGGPIKLTTIAPILRAIAEGNWVRLIDGRLEIKPVLPE